MSHHLLDLSLLLQIIQRLPCETAIDLQSINEGGDCDETIGLDVFVEFVGGGFVENDGVVGLVLDCSDTHDSVRGGSCAVLVTRRGDASGPRMESDGANVPFPFDHFFFCFLPADAAAGA